MKVKFTINGKRYIGFCGSEIINELYATGESYNENWKRGGFTIHIDALAIDEAETARGDLCLEVKSHMFKLLGLERIDDDEFKILMNERNSHIKPHEKIEAPNFGL